MSYKCDKETDCKSCQYKHDAIWRDYREYGMIPGEYFEYWAEIYLDGINTINTFIKERGDDTMIAALVEGSIGYFTTRHAELDLADYKRGNMVSWCERADACFRCDRVAMYVHDIRCFNHCDAAKQARLLDYVKATRELDSEKQMCLSLAYPTMNI